MDERDRSSREIEAAIGAAQQQLKAAATSTLEEHLRVVAQRRVDEELLAVRSSGVWDVDPAVVYEVRVQRSGT